MNASRVHLDAFVRRAAASVPPGAIVLDAGAGHGPYRAHFGHTRYEAADFERVLGDQRGSPEELHGRRELVSSGE